MAQMKGLLGNLISVLVNLKNLFHEEKFVQFGFKFPGVCRFLETDSKSDQLF